MTILSQLAFYVPSLLAHLLALVVAAVVFTRAKAPALLLAVGTGLQLLASVVSFGLYAWSTTAYTDGGWTSNDVSMVMGGVGIVTSVIRAIGEVVVVAAVGVAAFAIGRRGKADGADPYGFPPS